MASPVDSFVTAENRASLVVHRQGRPPPPQPIVVLWVPAGRYLPVFSSAPSSLWLLPLTFLYLPYGVLATPRVLLSGAVRRSHVVVGLVVWGARGGVFCPYKHGGTEKVETKDMHIRLFRNDACAGCVRL